MPSCPGPASLQRPPSECAPRQACRARPCLCFSELLLVQHDRRVRAVRDHVNVVRLDDELGVRVLLLLRHNLSELGVLASRFQALVPLFLRGIAPNIDEGVFGSDPDLRIALFRDPVPNIRNPVPSENGGCAGPETLRERVPLPRLGCVNAQFEESDGILLLCEAPANTRQAECKPQNRQKFFEIGPKAGSSLHQERGRRSRKKQSHRRTVRVCRGPERRGPSHGIMDVGPGNSTRFSSRRPTFELSEGRCRHRRQQQGRA